MKKANIPLQGTLWSMAIRNLGRRPRRTALSMLAIAVATLTMTLMFSMVVGIRYDLAHNLQRYYTGQILIQDRTLVKAGQQALNLAIPQVKAQVQTLKAIPEVRSVSPRLTGAASVFLDGESVFFPFLGMDFETDPMNLATFLQSGGSLPQPGARQALITTTLAQKLGLNVGDSLTAVSQTLRGSSNGMSFVVTGLVKPSLASFAGPWLFTSLETAQRFVHLSDGATALLVQTDNDQLSALAHRLQSQLQQSGLDQLEAKAWFESSTTYGLMDMAGLIYGLMGLVFFALASTVIINTMLMVVLERSGEIGMLAALGMDRRTIGGLFLAEGAILSGLGAAAGTLLGCVLTLILSVVGLDLSASLQGVDMEISGIMRPILEAWVPMVVFLSASLVAIIFTIIPVRRINRLNIVDALHGNR